MLQCALVMLLLVVVLAAAAVVVVVVVQHYLLPRCMCFQMRRAPACLLPLVCLYDSLVARARAYTKHTRICIHMQTHTHTSHSNPCGTRARASLITTTAAAPQRNFGTPDERHAHI